MVMDGDWSWDGEHTIQCTVVLSEHSLVNFEELCTSKLYNFVSQCHPHKFNKKEIQ